MQPKRLRRPSGRGLLVLSASMLVMAVGSAAASAAPVLHWYAGGSKTTPGKQIGWVSHGTNKVTIEWVYANTGARHEITCTGEEGHGTLENPAKGGAGIIETGLTGFKNCTEPGCFGSPLVLSNLATVGTATQFGEQTGIAFSQGEYTREIEIRPCSTPLTLVVVGKYSGILSGSNIELSKESTSGLHSNYGPVTIVGSIGLLETTAGQAITLAP